MCGRKYEAQTKLQCDCVNGAQKDGVGGPSGSETKYTAKIALLFRLSCSYFYFF